MSSEYDPSLINSLQVYVFNTKDKKRPPSLKYKQTYKLWKDIWKDALANEMNIKDSLTSDSLTKQDDIVGLFRDEECVGLFSSNTFRLDNPSDLDDSYFIDWNSSLLNNLRLEAEYVMTYENFTLAPSVRGPASDLPWKEVLLLLGLERQLKKNCPFMIATPRKNRSVHKATRRAGARTLAEDIPYKIPGEIVDLIVWDNGSPERVWEKKCWNLAQYLWAKKIDMSSDAKPNLTIVGGEHAAA